MINNRQLYQRALANDFVSFVPAVFRKLYPGTVFKPSWHHHALATEAEKMMRARSDRLIVSMPPRTLKSFILSAAYPAYLLGRDPSAKIVVVSYASNLAEDLSAETQRIMELDLYRAIFPQTVLQKRTKTDLITTAGGRRLATTIGGSITGQGGQYIIVDDPQNASHAFSEALQTVPNDYFDRTLSSRADDPTTAKFLVVMQRLGENDLAGHLRSLGGWRSVELEARATREQWIDIGGGRTHHVQPGDLLHSERMDADWLDLQRRTMGSAAFEAQYQQNPLPAEGSQIKREWLKRYTSLPTPRTGIVVQSWDTAYKTGAANDYSVCTTWLLQDYVSYLLHVWRGKVEFPALRDQVIRLYNEFSANRLIIEEAGSGTSLIQDLRISSPFNIITVKHNGAPKAARADQASGALESGRLLFPTDAPWLAEFEREVLGFPNAAHDDQVDSLTQYVAWITEHNASLFLVADWMDYPTTTHDDIAAALLAMRRY